MISKYNANIDSFILNKTFHRLIGQIYKLLPYREEGLDWEKPLNTIQLELAGMDALFQNDIRYELFHTTLFSLECKLEGLLSGKARYDFDLFRGSIFDCIGKVKVLQDLCQD